MLRVNVSIFFITVCLSGFAQGSIDLTPSFKKGEEKKYSVRYTTKSPAQAPYQIFSSTKKDIIIKVVDVRNGGTMDLEWVYANVIFTDSIPQFNPIMDLINTLSKGLTVKYTTDGSGRIKSVTNYKEITTVLNHRIDSLISLMSRDKSIASSLVESTKFQLQMMLSTEQQIDQIVIGDVFKFHEPYGNSFSTNANTLIDASDPATDKYETRLVSVKSNSCQLDGVLIDSKRKGHKSYDFQVPSYWLIRHSYRLDTKAPMSVHQSYEIKAVRN
ncbi:MAG: hypothetical protein ACKO96_42595 [Flammeovirgaceae bacterium]